MSSRRGWTYNGKTFAETHTERGGLRFFIDGKPTKKPDWFAEMKKAKRESEQGGAAPPAEVLDRKIKRIAQLAAENAADYRPSFVALLADSGWVAPVEREAA